MEHISIRKFAMEHQYLATLGLKQKVHFFKTRSEVVTELWKDPTKLIQNSQQYRQQNDGYNFSVLTHLLPMQGPTIRIYVTLL